jgi:hypothetical protein
LVLPPQYSIRISRHDNGVDERCVRRIFAIGWRLTRPFLRLAFDKRQMELRGLGTKSSQTPRWRKMDSNFQYASTVRWHRATDLRLLPLEELGNALLEPLFPVARGIPAGGGFDVFEMVLSLTPTRATGQSNWKRNDVSCDRIQPADGVGK